MLFVVLSYSLAIFIFYNKNIFKCVKYLFTDGYALIAVNTTVNCSLLGVVNSNRKKRKIAECNGENYEENDWVPTPKIINVSS